jgi:hypothetical protein
MFISFILTTPLSSTLATSVANLRCLSQILNPDFYPYLIPNPRYNNRKKGGDFFVAANKSNIKII